jgi:uncharacterized membrane protein
MDWRKELMKKYGVWIILSWVTVIIAATTMELNGYIRDEAGLTGGSSLNYGLWIILFTSIISAILMSIKKMRTQKNVFIVLKILVLVILVVCAFILGFYIGRYDIASTVSL